MSSSARTVHALQTSLRTKVYQMTDSGASRLQWPLFFSSLLLFDVVATVLAFWFAYYVRFHLSIDFFQLEVVPSLTYYRNLIFIITPAWLAIFVVAGLYQRDNLLGGTKEYSLLFNATTFGFVLVIAVGFLVPELVVARGWLLLAWFFGFTFTMVSRFMLRRFVYALRRQGYFLSPALIVGANEEGKMLAEQLLEWKTSGLLVVGFVDEETMPEMTVFQHLRSLGRMENLDEVIKNYKIREVVLTTSALSRSDMVAIFKKYGVSSNVTLRLSSGLFEIITTGIQVSELASVPLVRVNKVRLTGLDRFVKFLLDYVLTVPGLIVISPLLLLIALVIKLDSPGPAIHRRRVMGVNGVRFDAFKFRTMHINGDEILARYPELQTELAEKHKLVNDPRITRVGKFLRRASLDELPQLFNVLMREMSLVGPRMIAPEEMRKYDKWDMNLLTVQPGITGLWQVSGRSDISYDERVRLDMQYIRNWSIWLDIKILVETLPAMIKGRGAY